MNLPTPLYTAAAAVYPMDEGLKKRFTKRSNFGDPINLWAVRDGKLWLPREYCPMGEDRRVTGVPVSFELNFTPRNSEQERIVSSSLAYLQAGKSHIIQAATGTGKTVMSMPLIAGVGKKTLVVVTKSDIHHQWLNAFKQFLCLKEKHIGLIKGNVCSVTDKPVVIGYLQSLYKKGRYPDWVYREFGLVIWDETHRVSSDQFSQSVWNLPAKLRLGLSATPHRKDGKDIVLWGNIGPIAVKSEALLLTPKVLVKDIPGSLYNIPHSFGKTMHVNKILSSSFPRNKEIVSFVRMAFDKNRNCVIFTDTKKHIEILNDMLIAEGIPRTEIGVYVGGRSKSALEKAKAKSVVLATYRMCSEATDAPWWDTAVLATPRADVVQIIGRILREYPDKVQPVVLDLVDSSSPVFMGYWKARRKWYAQIGAEVVRV